MSDRSSDENVVRFISQLRQKGVLLSIDGERLLFKAPKGVLSPADSAGLKAHKVRIVALMRLYTVQATRSPQIQFPTGGGSIAAPATLAQLSEWRSHRLAEQPSFRSTFSVLRALGHLDLHALEAALAAIIQRHSALRTRIIVEHGQPMQVVDPHRHFRLQIDDVSDRSEQERESALAATVQQLILLPVSYAQGPLFDVMAMRLRDCEHVLIFVMDHLVADGYSSKLLLRETVSAYQRSCKDMPAFESVGTPGSADYGFELERLRGHLRQQYVSYWAPHLLGCHRTRFPSRERIRSDSAAGWCNVPVCLPRDTKVDLIRWSRAHRTSTVLGAFTAFVALVLRWCGQNETVMRFQVSNRDRGVFANTVGFLASRLHLNIHCQPDDSLLDLLQRVAAEHRAALEHNDLGYLECLYPLPDVCRNAIFSWTPAATNNEYAAPAQARDAVQFQTIPMANPGVAKLRWDNEPVLLLYDTNDDVRGDLLFSLDRHSKQQMVRFAANFPIFVRHLIDSPSTRVRFAPLT